MEEQEGLLFHWSFRWCWRWCRNYSGSFSSTNCHEARVERCSGCPAYTHWGETRYDEWMEQIKHRNDFDEYKMIRHEKGFTVNISVLASAGNLWGISVDLLITLWTNPDCTIYSRVVCYIEAPSDIRILLKTEGKSGKLYALITHMTASGPWVQTCLQVQTYVVLNIRLDFLQI